MDHWKIRENNCIVVLLEHYMEMHDQNKRKRAPFVTTRILKPIIEDLKEEEEFFVFIDMKYVNEAASRVFSFLKEERILDRIVFFHVPARSRIREILNADLHGKEEENKSELLVYFSDEAKRQFQQINIEKLCRQKRISVLSNYVNDKVDFLQSSGVYSNMSLNYKRMFENQQDFKFAVGELYYIIQGIKVGQKIDFLVAASKNAIALTAILSCQLEIPAIYHTNIGQKYVKQGSTDRVENQRENVKKRKRYLMIFDVICLGTEARILNATLNILGGDLIGAAGLVCVQDPKEIRQYDADSILAKVHCLATAKEMGLGYRIALTREELKEN